MSSVAKTTQVVKSIEYLFDQPTKLVVIGASDPLRNAWEVAEFPKTAIGRKDARAFIEKWNGEGRNIYFKDASLTQQNTWKPSGHPTKAHATEFYCAHLDVDVKGFHDVAKDPDGFTAKKKLVLANLLAFKPQPTEVVNTGNGYQGRWYFDTPTKDVGAVEAINHALAHQFGGDQQCADVTHWYRVPHTINYPNQKKIDAGRVKCRGGIAFGDGNRAFGFNVYSLDALPKLQAMPKVDVKSVGTVSAEEFDLMVLPKDYRRLIQFGPKYLDPDNKRAIEWRKMGAGDWSGYATSVAAYLRKLGWSDGQIVGVLTDPNLAVGVNVRKTIEGNGRSLEEQASRVIDWLNETGVKREVWPETSPQYAELNPWVKETALLVKPAGFVSNVQRDFMPDKQFVKKYGSCFAHKENAVDSANKSAVIQKFDALGYRPNGPGEWTENKLRTFNLYKRPSIEPLNDRLPEIFLAHLRYLVPDQKQRNYLLDWMAHLIKYPELKMQFAPLLIGPGGTGKSWLLDLLCVLVGDGNHWAPRNKTLGNKFNAWLPRHTLIGIHELHGNENVAEVLQDLITQRMIEVEFKGADVVLLENFANFFAISNYEKPLPVDANARRWMPLTCAEVPFGAKPEPDGEKPYTATPEMTAYYKALFASQMPTEPPTEESRRVYGFLMRHADREKYPSYAKSNFPKLDVMGLAPATDAFDDLVRVSRSELATLVHDAYRHREPPFNGEVFDLVGAFEKHYQHASLDPRDRTPTAFRLAVKAVGCRPIPGARKGDAYRTWWNGRHVPLWTLSAAKAAEYAKLDAPTLAEMYEKAQAGWTRPGGVDDSVI